MALYILAQMAAQLHTQVSTFLLTAILLTIARVSTSIHELSTTCPAICCAVRVKTLQTSSLIIPWCR